MKKENIATFTVIYWISLQRIVKKSCCTLMGQKPGHKGDVWDLWTESLSGITVIFCNYLFSPLSVKQLLQFRTKPVSLEQYFNMNTLENELLTPLKTGQYSTI